MSDQRLQATEHACIQLAAHGEPVTFIAVAARTGIPSVTLYRNLSLRAVARQPGGSHRGPILGRLFSGGGKGDGGGDDEFPIEFFGDF